MGAHWKTASQWVRQSCRLWRHPYWPRCGWWGRAAWTACFWGAAVQLWRYLVRAERHAEYQWQTRYRSIRLWRFRVMGHPSDALSVQPRWGADCQHGKLWHIDCLFGVQQWLGQLLLCHPNRSFRKLYGRHLARCWCSLHWRLRGKARRTAVQQRQRLWRSRKAAGTGTGVPWAIATPNLMIWWHHPPSKGTH